jgi:hypothetical protein
MRRPSNWVFIAAVVLAFAACRADAQTTWTYETIYTIPQGESYQELGGNLIQGSDGNFWGITAMGTIFRLTPGGDFTVIAQTPDPESDGIVDFSLVEDRTEIFMGSRSAMREMATATGRSFR